MDNKEFLNLKQKDTFFWSVSEVGRWLVYSDLSEYKILFIENSISGAELFDIEEEDLVGLGVINPQHRKRILREIGQLKDNEQLSCSSNSDDLSASSCQRRLSLSSSNSGSSSHSSESKVVAKCKYKNDIRLVSLSQASTLKDIKRKIRKVFGRSLEFKVIDSDGDLVSVKSDKDLRAILHQCSSLKLKLSRRKKRTKTAHEKEKLEESLASDVNILENLLEACVVTGTDCYIKFFNCTAEKLFGYSKEEVIGRNCNILMPSNYAVLHDQFVKNYLKTGKSSIIGRSRNVTGLHKSGKILSLELSLTESNSISSHTITAIFKPVNVQSTDCNIGCNRPLEALIDPVVTIDGKGIITFINSAALSFFGYLREELVGQNISILMPSPHQENHDYYIQNYLRTKKSTVIGKSRQLICELSDGSIKPITLSVSEIYDGNGERQFLGVIRPQDPSIRPPDKPRPFLNIEREIVNNLVVASVIIDQHGTIQGFNKSAQQLFGYELAEILGENVNILIANKVYHDNHHFYMQKYLNSGEKKAIGMERVVNGITKRKSIIKAKLSVVQKIDPVTNKIYFTGMFHSLPL